MTEHQQIARSKSRLVSWSPCRRVGFLQGLGILPWIFVLVVLGPVQSQSWGQLALGLSTPFELSDSVHLDEADSATKTHLEQVRAFLTNQQYDEAIETLRSVMEDDTGKVIAVSPRRYISVRDYCQLQIAELPPAALAIYRNRVDPQAEKWYRQGLADHDPHPLLDVVSQLFCSSWGDDALYALGELALERGNYGGARGYWEQILPAVSRNDGAPNSLTYPDTDLKKADVLARLTLVSIMEGSVDQARGQLESIRHFYPAAEGRLGGRQVNYVEALSALLAENASWPHASSNRDWLTFGGSPERNRVVPGAIDIGPLKWQQPLPKAPVPDITYSLHRPAETREDLLSYHPVVVGNLLLVNTTHEIRGYDLQTGKPAWADNPVIYPPNPSIAEEPETRTGSRTTLGAPRFTMTVHDNKLYARMGNPLTSSPNEPLIQTKPGYLICLDLAKQGSCVWDSQQTYRLDDKWAFEGSPVSDGTYVYVGMRRSDVRPQAHVACFDAQTGRLRWRRMVCSAETPGQGQMDEITHNLVTLHCGTVYYNTNLGAVAALNAEDGQIKWVTLYQRATTGDLTQRAAHFYRDLTPCIYDGGRLFVAPSDSEFVLGLDAATGLLLWRSGGRNTANPGDAVHLLGVGGGNLLASGDKLWWIQAATGKIARVVWPDGRFPPSTDASSRGFGRGALVGDKVYWPTRQRIYVFDQGNGAEARQPIELSTRDAQGGNLLVAGGHLFIITSDRIMAFEQQSHVAPLAGKVTKGTSATQPELVTRARPLGSPRPSLPASRERK
jgi:outer membrane protein assembly factor BamB